MTDDGSAWTGDGGADRADKRRSVTVTTLLGRGRRRLRACRRCVVCGCISWLLLGNLVIDSVQGKYFSRSFSNIR